VSSGQHPRNQAGDLPRLLVVFGLPGAGKTYAGRVIAETLGFHFYDGDTDLPDALLHAIRASQPVSEAMRDEFFSRILASLDRLTPIQPRVLLAQTFIKEKYRRWVLDRYPQAQFILVEADPSVRQHRLEHRTAMPLALDYVRQMDTLFDPPQIPHLVLDNNQAGPLHIREWAQTHLEISAS
jgi:gluconate kinase